MRTSSRFVASLTLLAGCAPASYAQNTRITFDARVNGGTWTPSRIDARPGDTIDVRLRVSLVNTTRTTVGFAGITLQPTLDGWNESAGDAVLPFDPFFDTRGGGGVAPGGIGRQFPFNTGVPNIGIIPPITTFVDNGTRLRWSGTLNTGGGTTLVRGVGLGQQTVALIGTSFNAEPNPVLFIYRVRLGNLRAGANDGSEFLDASAPLNLINLQRGAWYTLPGGTGGPFNASVTESTIDPVRIVVVPAPPAAFALLGLALVVPYRRRPSRPAPL